VPGIHVFAAFATPKDVDGRDKPGHDGKERVRSNLITLKRDAARIRCLARHRMP
jgi:hypothetical protein